MIKYKEYRPQRTLMNMNGLDIKSKIIAVIIIIMIVYVVIVFYSDINKFSDQFRDLKAEMIIVILVIEIGSLTLRNIRQKIFLDSFGVKLSFKENYKICLIGMAMIVTPGGAGMLIKSHYLKNKHKIPISKTTAIVFAERYHDFLAATTILIISLIVTYHTESVLSAIISSALLISVYVIMKNKFLAKKVLHQACKIKLFRKIVLDIESLEISKNPLVNSKTMFAGWMISVIMWTLDAVAIYLAFLTFNLDIDFFEAIQVFFTALIYGTISFLPAGIGVTEGIFIKMLLNNGIALETASALILFIRLTTIWFVTFLGFLSFRFFLKK